MLSKRTLRDNVLTNSLTDRRPSKESTIIFNLYFLGKLSRGSSPSSANHFAGPYAEEFSDYGSEGSQSQYNSEVKISNIKLKKKLNDL